MVKQSGKDPTVQIRLNDPAGRILGNQVMNGDMRKTATAIVGALADSRQKISAIYLETENKVMEVKAIGGRVDVPAVFTVLGRMFPGR